MRSLMLGAAALLAAYVAAPAAYAVTGHADVSYTRSDADDFGDDELDTFALGGVVAFDANELGVQLDGFYANVSSDGDDADVLGVGGHLYKQSDSWLWGGYAGYTNTDADGGDSVDEWTLAGETQFYLARTTLGAALVYSTADDIDVDTWLIEGDAKHFYHDNLAVAANLGFGQVDTDGGDGDVWTAGLGGEWQLASVPVSFIAGYQHTDFEDFGGDVDALSIGARWNWGGTLFDRNRSGGDLKRRSGTLGRLYGVS